MGSLHPVLRRLLSNSNLTDGAQGTGGDRGTQADSHGQSGRHRGLEGMPLPLHTARARPGWGEGMCRGARSTEACHKGGEVLSREKPQWR